ncbi:MAG TPA: hypothetical protein PKL44_00455 [Candidatus Dojkabacteria bacterium]|nr:hypothetical protein [Candidatus Dojkabacteria bacterium]
MKAIVYDMTGKLAVRPIVTLDQVYKSYKYRVSDTNWISISAIWSFGEYVDYVKTLYTVY